MGKILSYIITVPSVVLQGSKLNPTLFLVFINDLLLFLNKSSYALYADDTTIHTHNFNIDIIENDLQTDCGNAQNWRKYSIKKTSSMLIGTKKNLVHFAYTQVLETYKACPNRKSLEST